jgi:hypothetical protein
MSSPYDPYGYQRLREIAADTFTHIAVIEDTGAEITRIDVTSDSRVVNTPEPSTNPLNHTIEITGTDNDINPPVTISATKLYETNSGSTPIGTDTAKDATIESPGDTVTISHKQQIPQQ